MRHQCHGPNQLSYVVFEEDRKLAAVCLERFIGTQGNDMDEVRNRLKAVYRMELDLSMERCGEPFGDIEQAPTRYHEIAENAEFVAHGTIHEDTSISNSSEIPVALAA